MGIYSPPQAQELDNNGDPLSGGKLNFYEVGTTTRKDTYQDRDLQTTHANPVVADSSGRWEPIYLDGNYKIVLTDADDVVIWTEDNVSGGVEQIFSETEDVTATGTIDSIYDKKHIRFNSASNITANLLDLASAGEGFAFSFQNDGTGTVTLDPNASELINDAATWVIPPRGSGVAIAGTTGWGLTDSLGIPQSLTANDILFLDSNKKLASGTTLAGNYTFSGNNTFSGKVLVPDDGELTISTGEITVTGTYHTVDTESDASSDDLVTINGGSDGQLLVLRTEDDARDVTLKTTGNIDLPADVTLGTSSDVIFLIYDGAKSKWLQSSATSAQGALADTAVQPADISSVISYLGESSTITITSDGETTVAHGQAAEPKIVKPKIVCNSAELGYSVGDEVYLEGHAYSSTVSETRGVVFTKDDTNVYVNFGTQSTLWRLPNKGGTGDGNIVNSKWDLVLEYYG